MASQPRKPQPPKKQPETPRKARLRQPWELLVNRYNNRKIICSKHVKELLHLNDVTHNTAAEYRSLINQVCANARAPEALNFEIPINELIFPNITSHMEYFCLITAFSRKAVPLAELSLKAVQNLRVVYHSIKFCFQVLLSNLNCFPLFLSSVDI
jgi:hypothetical protein